ncbi:hypothetical protein FKM82_025964 [Ascaphus truei]
MMERWCRGRLMTLKVLIGVLYLRGPGPDLIMLALIQRWTELAGILCILFQSSLLSTINWPTRSNILSIDTGALFRMILF